MFFLFGGRGDKLSNATLPLHRVVFCTVVTLVTNFGQLVKIDFHTVHTSYAICRKVIGLSCTGLNLNYNGLTMK